MEGTDNEKRKPSHTHGAPGAENRARRSAPAAPRGPEAPSRQTVATTLRCNKDQFLRFCAAGGPFGRKMTLWATAPGVA